MTDERPVNIATFTVAAGFGANGRPPKRTKLPPGRKVTPREKPVHAAFHRAMVAGHVHTWSAPEHNEWRVLLAHGQRVTLTFNEAAQLAASLDPSPPAPWVAIPWYDPSCRRCRTEPATEYRTPSGGRGFSHFHNEHGENDMAKRTVLDVSDINKYPAPGTAPGIEDAVVVKGKTRGRKAIEKVVDAAIANGAEVVTEVTAPPKKAPAKKAPAKAPAKKAPARKPTTAPTRTTTPAAKAAAKKAVASIRKRVRTTTDPVELAKVRDELAKVRDELTKPLPGAHVNIGPAFHPNSENIMFARCSCGWQSQQARRSRANTSLDHTAHVREVNKPVRVTASVVPIPRPAPARPPVVPIVVVPPPPRPTPADRQAEQLAAKRARKACVKANLMAYVARLQEPKRTYAAAYVEAIQRRGIRKPDDPGTLWAAEVRAKVARYSR